MKKTLLKIFIAAFLLIPLLFVIGFCIYVDIKFPFVFGLILGIRITIVLIIGICTLIEIFDYG